MHATHSPRVKRVVRVKRRAKSHVKRTKMLTKRVWSSVSTWGFNICRSIFAANSAMHWQAASRTAWLSAPVHLQQKYCYSGDPNNGDLLTRIIKTPSLWVVALYSVVLDHILTILTFTGLKLALVVTWFPQRYKSRDNKLVSFRVHDCQIQI